MMRRLEKSCAHTAWIVSGFALPAMLVMPLALADTKLSPSPEGAAAYIISPADGEVVGETVTVKFGLQGMGVAPAGVDKPNTGHHHLLVDGEKLPDLKQPLGKEVMHFGGGQTQKVIHLKPGKHTLQLILGNHQHIPHDPPVVSEKITIIVR